MLPDEDLLVGGDVGAGDVQVVQARARENRLRGALLHLGRPELPARLATRELLVSGLGGGTKKGYGWDLVFFVHI